DPGAHVVKVSADGWESAESKFNVAEGGSATVPITLKKSAAAPVAAVPGAAPAQPETTPATSSSMANADTGVSSSGSSQKTIGWVALAVGAAGLATGAITGFIALGKHSDLQNSCPNNTCPSDKQSDVDSFHTMGTISTIGFIVGLAGAGAGTVLILTAPKN